MNLLEGSSLEKVHSQVNRRLRELHVSENEQGHSEEVRSVLEKQSHKVYLSTQLEGGKRNTAALSHAKQEDKETQIALVCFYSLTPIKSKADGTGPCLDKDWVYWSISYKRSTSG